MNKVTKISSTLARLFDAHKANFIASGKLSHHHYKTLRFTFVSSDLPPEKNTANEITSKDIRSILNDIFLIWKMKLIEIANNSYIHHINYLSPFIYQVNIKPTFFLI